MAYSDAMNALNPVAYWRLGDSTTTIVDETGNHNGTISGIFTQGMPSLVGDNNGALQASTATVVVPHSSALNPTGDYTITFVAKWAATEYGVIYSKSQNTSEYEGPTVYVNMTANPTANTAGYVTFRDKWNGSTGLGFQVVTTTGGLNDGVVRNFVCVRRGLVLEIWIDGVLDATTTMPSLTAFTSTDALTLLDTLYAAHHFQGSIDEIAYFNKALSEAEISNLHTIATATGVAGNLPTPAAYWTLDADKIDAGSYLINEIDRTKDLVGISNVTTVTGYVNDGIYFTGDAASYLYLEANQEKIPELEALEHTLSTWVKVPNIPADWANLIDNNLYYAGPSGGTNNGGTGLFIDPTGRFVASYAMVSPEAYTDSNGNSANSYGVNAFGTSIVQPDTWYHVVGVFTANTAKLYVNGVLESEVTTIGSQNRSVDHRPQFALGRLGYGAYYMLTGTLDEVKCWGSTLSEAQVLELYNSEVARGFQSVEDAITALSPAAYWKLDDLNSEAVTDSSGNGFDGYWVGVSAAEANQDDMLGDGVVGLKPLASEGNTGYMENTSVFALGSADTDNYTLLVWAKGFNGTDVDVLSWATTAIGTTKEYRGTVKINVSGEISWNRLYQTGTSVFDDTGYQSATTSGLGLVSDVPYLIALRESSTLTEILVNGSVVLSLPRVGMGVNDTTYAPREELRIGNETIFSGTSTASSYVHGALWSSNLTDEQIRTIYDAFSEIDKTGTMATDQLGQSSSGYASKTGSLGITGSIVSYQEDRLIESGEFISQEVSISASYTSPDNYIVSNQVPQGTILEGVSTGDPLTVRYSTHGITTSKDSTPASTPIQPRLLNAGNYKNEIDINDIGVVTPSFGQIVLDNTDGELDGLVDKAFDGGSYKLYYGPKNGKFPDDFTKVVDTVMGKPTFDHRTVKIQLKDKMDFLDQPFVGGSFTGTGNINGTSIVKGEPKQRVIGRVWGVPAQLIDAEKLVYWVCDDKMSSSNITNNNNSYTDNQYRSPPNNWNDSYSNIAYGRVFDGGTQITNGQDYARQADLFAISPPAGTVRWYRPSNSDSVVLFRLGSSPAADIRVDIQTSPNGSSDWTLNDIISERPEISVSGDSTNVNITRGFFVDNTNFTYKDAVREFMKRDFYFARFNRDGELKVSQVATPNPSDTPLYEFNESNMSNITIDQVIPAWKLYINSGEAVGGQVNTGVPDARKDEFTETPYHTTSEYEEPATRSRHKLSEILSVDVKSWWNADDINTHSDLAKVFLMQDRVRLTVTLDRGHMNSTTLLLDIGDTVSVKMPRYNFNLGKNFIIHSVRHDYQQGRLTYTLWG